MPPPTTPSKSKKQPSSSNLDSPWLLDETLSPGLIDTSLQDLNLADTPLAMPRSKVHKPIKSRPSWGAAPILDSNNSVKVRGKMRFLNDLDAEKKKAPLVAGAKPAARPRFSLFAKDGLPSGLAPKKVLSKDEQEEDQTIQVDASQFGTTPDEEGDDTFLRDALLGKSTSNAPTTPGNPQSGSKETPEQIQRQLFELRRMNEVFEAYEKMLRGSAGQIDAFAKRITETDDLLNIYIDLLRQTEKTQQLLHEGDWKGATEDATAHELSLALAERETERLQAEAQAREEAAAAAIEAAQQKAAEEAARKEEAKRAPASGARGRGRGVPVGTRGARGGVARAASTAAARGRGIPRASTTTRPPAAAAATRGGTNVGRGRPSMTTTTTTRGGSTSVSGIPTRASSGLGGQYANVKSSGYGPR